MGVAGFTAGAITPSAKRGIRILLLAAFQVAFTVLYVALEIDYGEIHFPSTSLLALSLLGLSFRAFVAEGWRRTYSVYLLTRQLMGTPMARMTPRSTSSMRNRESGPPIGDGLRAYFGNVVICSHFKTAFLGRPPVPFFNRT